MHSVICDVINYCARSCDMGKISVNDKMLIENLRKKGDNISIREISTNAFWVDLKQPPVSQGSRSGRGQGERRPMRRQ